MNPLKPNGYFVCHHV